MPISSPAQPPEKGPEQGPDNIFGRWARFVLGHRRAVAAVMLALTVVALGLVSTLDVDSDLLVLMPSDLPEVHSLDMLLEEEGGVNLVTVAVRGERDATHQALAELQVRLEADDKVDYAIFDIPDELAWRLGVLQLSVDELEGIRDRLNGALALGPAAANPFISARLLDLGPMTDRLREADARSGLMAVGDIERLVIRPTGAARDIPFSRELMGFVDAELDALELETRGVELAWISGAYHFNVEDYEGVRSDIQRTGVGSVVLVLVLLTAAFRNPKALFFVFTPLLCGTLWTFGFAAIAVGTLNTFTSILGAVLVGLGIDFSIHLFARFREERLHSEDVEQAVIRAWNRVGPPCLAAAITSAGGFAALMSADFKGFAQMGLLLCVGVLLCLNAVLTVLPLLLVWRGAPAQRRLAWPRGRRQRRPATYGLAPMGLSLLVMVTVVGAMVARGIEFEFDLSELRKDGESFADMSEEQQELTRLSYAAIVASYPSDAELREADTRIRGQIEDGSLKHIGRAMSFYSLVPQDQDKRLGVLGEIARLSEQENYSYLPAAVRGNLDRLATMPLDPVTREDLPRSLRHLVGASEDYHRLLLFAAGNIWDLREVNALKNEAGALETPDYEAGRYVAGQYMVAGSLYDVIERDAPIMGGVALLLVAIATLLATRRPKRALGVLAVLAVGMVWAGGMVAMTKVKLSIVNIVGIPILLGIGVDVIIHLLHRLAEEGPGRVLRALSTTGWAAGLSSATTVLSFTALVLATAEGVRSLGMLVLVGLSTLTIAAFLVVPVGWMTVWKIGGAAPGDQPDEE